MSKGTLTIALAGQPNCGKSTLFNLLTGARQFVANYPGVTVDKTYGICSIGTHKHTIVDLPGTYSFTSYSPEERAARDFILHDKPDLVIAVVDASTLEKGLYFILQLLEMGRPVIVALNMMDVAQRRGLNPSAKKLSELLNVPVIELQASKKIGHKELIECAEKEASKEFLEENISVYNPLEDTSSAPLLDKLANIIKQGDYPKEYSPHWLATKVFDADPAIMDILCKNEECFIEIQKNFSEISQEIQEKHTKSPAALISFERHQKARNFTNLVLQNSNTTENNELKSADTYTPSITDRIDSVLCHKFFGPLCLLGILFIFYQVSVTWGNELAAYVWPFWASLEVIGTGLLPNEGFLVDPFITFFGNWLIKSLTSIMNYLPIFFLMFSFVAILEGCGYLARIAFILDKIFHMFGLHGQSTLPLIIGGIYVGGCAIPGVVATRAIPDERARFATILIVPMMNCLAKVPLYLMLISIFFAAEAGSAMFFIGTITLIMGLIVAKVLTLTLLKGYPPSPFIIELPSYHLPLVRNVLQEAIIRVWVFIKKIFKVVLVVSSAVFILVYFPNVSTERQAFYLEEQNKAENAFMQAVAKTAYAHEFTKEDIVPLILYQTELRNLKLGKSQEQAKLINDEQLLKNPIFASIVLRQGDDGKALAGALRRIDSSRKSLRRQYQTERFENSILGRTAKALEPVTSGAGFTWRINIALLSALAAKENTAATLGVLYGIDGSTTAESFKETESTFTPLHALALMLFMALFPPCLAAAMMVKTQTNSTGWMIFSIVFQMTIGIFVSTLVFSGGTYLGLTGVQAMWTFYALCVVIMLILGFIPAKNPSYGTETPSETLSIKSQTSCGSCKSCGK